MGRSPSELAISTHTAQPKQTHQPSARQPGQPAIPSTAIAVPVAHRLEWRSCRSQSTGGARTVLISNILCPVISLSLSTRENYSSGLSAKKGYDRAVKILVTS